MRAPRLIFAAAACLSLAACFGGAKVPPTLLTLTPSAAPAPNIARSANAGEALTIEVPVLPEELDQVRVPAQESPSAITYIEDLQWVDRPNRLFQQLLTETAKRTTNRVVLEPRQASLDPGLRVSGVLQRFGYDVASGQVVIVYDAALSTDGGTRVETRRFTASAPAVGTAESVGPALNQIANQVALEVARWVAG